MSKDQQSLRASYEDLLEAQKELRKKLHRFIQENKPIEDFEEKEEFRDLVDRACLGIEGKIEVEMYRTGYAEHKREGKDPFEETLMLFRGTISQFVTYVLNLDQEEIFFAEEGTNTRSKDDAYTTEVEIREFWGKILTSLENRVFPKSREMAFKATPEREPDEEVEQKTNFRG